jgi:hypothetical protein
MADQVTKIIIRRGTDVQRRTANTTGIVFDQGEPAWVTDTTRLFVGDGSTAGGIATGMRNLGSVSSLFGGYLQGYSSDGYSAITDRGIEVGDIIYDRTTRNIYSLSSRSTFPPLTSEFVKYDSLALVNASQFYFDSSFTLNIKQQGVGIFELNSNVADGITITKAGPSSPLTLATGSISNGVDKSNFKYIPANSVLLNNTGSLGAPDVVLVQPKQFIGRTTSSALTALGFGAIATGGVFNGINGVALGASGDTLLVGLSSDIFTVAPPRLLINSQTTINPSLSVAGPITSSGNLSARAAYFDGTVVSTGDIVAYFTSDKKLKDNLVKINTPLTKIKTLNGYEFTWNKNAPEHLHGKDIGVEANEVESTLPEAVIRRNDGIKAVNYIKLIPLLIESVKELTTKVEQLESKIL